MHGDSHKLFNLGPTDIRGSKEEEEEWNMEYDQGLLSQIANIK